MAAPPTLLGTPSDVPRIGPVLASRIIDRRESVGRFADIGELKDIDGIGETKLLQLIQALLLVFLQIAIFSEYNFAMDLTYAIVFILLAGDALEVYHGVIKNALTKEGRRSLFKADKI